MIPNQSDRHARANPAAQSESDPSASALVIALWAIPVLAVGGMRKVTACAGEAPMLQTSADLSFGLVRCTGAFFLAND